MQSPSILIKITSDQDNFCQTWCKNLHLLTHLLFYMKVLTNGNSFPMLLTSTSQLIFFMLQDIIPASATAAPPLIGLMEELEGCT
jgi:hypothetical protein